MKNLFTKLGLVAAVVFAPMVASAAQIDIDTTDLEASISSVGGSMISVAVLMLTVAVVYGFIRKRG